MKLNLSSSKYLILVIVLVLIIIGVVIAKLLPDSVKNPKNPDAGPAAGSSYTAQTEQDKAAGNESAKVSQMITKLPYKGKNFRIKYDFASYTFLIAINKAQEDQANKEFDQFLRDNGISSRTPLHLIHVDFY